jgi:hypothetical protein
MSARKDHDVHATGCPTNARGEWVMSNLPCGKRSRDSSYVADNPNHITCLVCLRWWMARAREEDERAYNEQRNRAERLTAALREVRELAGTTGKINGIYYVVRATMGRIVNICNAAGIGEEAAK